MKKIMSINAGSSSLKFQLLEMPEEKIIAKGIVERIGLDNGVFKMSIGDKKIKDIKDIKTHSDGVKILLEELKAHKAVENFSDISGVAHRVVHGGEKFVDSVVIDDKVIEAIEEVSDLAPLHNPVNLVGIRAFLEVLPGAVPVAVFDTAFHQTMEPEAYIYPTPYEWYENYGIRKYGFHGTSHKFVSLRAAELLGKKPEEVNVITCHIGNGASICAVKEGKSVDTTMGMTPLAGIAMGTRSGDIDPAIIEFIGHKEGHTISEVINKLNKESGLLGISGLSSDSREVREGLKKGDQRCALAHKIQSNGVASFVSSYFTYMGGADAIVFTAGVGENDTILRGNVCDRISVLGVSLDKELNSHTRDEGVITKADSKVKVFVIPTNEELMMAKDVYRLISE